MGARGGGWVAAQFALMSLVFVSVAVGPGWPDAISTVLVALGGALVVVGVAVVVWAARTMGRSLTPFPEPAASAELVEHGPFAHVRHPVYSGFLAVCVGWSLFGGPLTLALTGALALLWVGKMRAEERRLDGRFAGYAAYRARVRWKLVPGVF